MDYDYLARERALVMAQHDFHSGMIPEERVIARACQYEAYLRARPILLDSEQMRVFQECDSS